MPLPWPSRVSLAAFACLVLPSLAGCGADVRTGTRVAVVTDVVYARDLGMALTFDAFLPEQRNGGGVLFINSGGFVSGQGFQYARDGLNAARSLESDELHLEGDTTPIPLLEQFSFAPLLEAGFVVFDVRHRSGPMFGLPEIVADVARAVSFVRDHAADFRIDADRIGVWGASSGGYLALRLALAPGNDVASVDGSPLDSQAIRAVVAYYPAGFDFASDVKRFPELLQALPALQVDSAVLDSLSLKRHLTSKAPPTLIIYGEDDFPFIVEPSEAVCAGLTAAGAECRLIVIPGVGHEFRGADRYHAEAGRQALADVVTWFRQKLRER